MTILFSVRNDLCRACGRVPRICRTAWSNESIRRLEILAVLDVVGAVGVLSADCHGYEVGCLSCVADDNPLELTIPEKYAWTL